MTIYAPVATLTKAELLLMLAAVPDDAKVYVMATRSVVQMAVDGAKVGPRDAYFGLSGNVQREADGVSLVAAIRPA